MKRQSKLEEEEDKRVRSPRRTLIIESPNPEEGPADPHHRILRFNRRRQQEEENRRSNDYYQNIKNN